MGVASVDVANMALAHVGAKGRIGSFVEKSEEAQRVSQFWQSATEATLRAYDWNFARRYVNAEPIPPAAPHWTWSYAYPARCAAVRRLYPAGYQAGMDHVVMGANRDVWGDTRLESQLKTVAFEVLARDDGQRAICTHQENPTIRFTRLTDTAELWDPLFSDSFAYQLATRLVPSLAPATGRAERVRDLAVQFRTSLEIAQAADAQEGYEDHNREAPWLGYGV